MKKLYINNKSKVILKEVKDPIIETKGLLVKTSFALISSGTELGILRSKKIEALPFLKNSLNQNFSEKKNYLN